MDREDAAARSYGEAGVCPEVLPAEAERRHDLRFALNLHWAVIILVPTLTLLGRREVGPAFWGVLALAALCTGTLQHLATGRSLHPVWPTAGYAMLAGDLLLVSALVWSKGGLASDTYHLYYLVIVGAGVVFGVRASILTALGAGVLYGLAVWLAAAGQVQDPDLGRVAVRTVYLALTGAAAAYLAHRERAYRLAHAEVRRLLAELEEAHARLRTYARDMSRRAVTDGLTGLYNHTHFNRRLSDELVRAKRYGRPLSLMMLDLDDFKKYNDAFGHVEGDRLLARMGSVLSRAVREVDTVFRYGGEEFTIIMPETGTEQARKAAERIRGIVEEAFGRASGSEGRGPMTVSIGVASFPVHGSTGTELIEAADRALYLSKKLGKNRISVHGT